MGSKKKHIIKIVVFIYSSVIRLILLIMSCIMLGAYASHTYEVICPSEVTLTSDTMCTLYEEGKLFEYYFVNTCAWFNLGDTKPHDVEKSNLAFPLSGFNRFMIAVGMLAFFLAYISRLVIDISYVIRKLSKKCHCMKKILKFVRVKSIFGAWALDVFAVAWAFPIYMFKYDDQCVRSLYDYDKKQDENQNVTTYTFVLLIFSIIILGLDGFLYLKMMKRSNKWRIITIIVMIALNVIFTMVAINKCWGGSEKLYAAIVFIFLFLWIGYGGEAVIIYKKWFKETKKWEEGEKTETDANAIQPPPAYV